MNFVKKILLIICLLFLTSSELLRAFDKNNKPVKVSLLDKTKNLGARILAVNYLIASSASTVMTFKDLRDASDCSDGILDYTSRLIWPAVDLGNTAGFLYCAKNLFEYNSQTKAQVKPVNNLNKNKNKLLEHDFEFVYEYEDDSATNWVKGLSTGWVAASSLIMAAKCLKRSYKAVSANSENIPIALPLILFSCSTAVYLSKKLLPKSFEYLKKAIKG